NEFNAFGANDYPAHLTALLEVDLLRLAAEVGLSDVCIEYSQRGRIPFTSHHYPRWLGRALPRPFSDQILLLARKNHSIAVSPPPAPPSAPPTHPLLPPRRARLPRPPRPPRWWAMPTLRMPPRPSISLRLAARLIHHLPLGRYRLMNRLCRRPPQPFLASMP